MADDQDLFDRLGIYIVPIRPPQCVEDGCSKRGLYGVRSGGKQSVIELRPRCLHHARTLRAAIVVRHQDDAPCQPDNKDDS